MAILTMENVEVFYGHVQALRGVSLTVDEGEVVALLGNNGAGKTTTLSTVSALERPRAGKITFDGTDITAARPWDVVGNGLIHVPESRRIFSTLTVKENLQLGGYLVKDKALINQRIDHVFDLLPILAQRQDQEGGTLSGGEQQMLAIARALIAGPRLLMLDEPSMGLSPLMMKRIMSTVRELNGQGTTVLLVEQNAPAALKLATKGYVLEVGQIVVSGTGAELLGNDEVRKAYLGED